METEETNNDHENEIERELKKKIFTKYSYGSVYKSSINKSTQRPELNQTRYYNWFHLFDEKVFELDFFTGMSRESGRTNEIIGFTFDNKCMDSPKNMINHVAFLNNYSSDYVNSEEYRGDAGLGYFVDHMKSARHPKFKRMVIENTDECSYSIFSSTNEPCIPSFETCSKANIKTTIKYHKVELDQFIFDLYTANKNKLHNVEDFLDGHREYESAIAKKDKETGQDYSIIEMEKCPGSMKPALIFISAEKSVDYLKIQASFLQTTCNFYDVILDRVEPTNKFIFNECLWKENDHANEDEQNCKNLKDPLSKKDLYTCINNEIVYTTVRLKILEWPKNEPEMQSIFWPTISLQKPQKWPNFGAAPKLFS